MSADHDVKAIVAIVPTADMQLSLAFYKVLGFQVNLYGDGKQYAFLHLDGNYIHLRLAGPSELTTNPRAARTPMSRTRTASTRACSPKASLRSARRKTGLGNVVNLRCPIPTAS